MSLLGALFIVISAVSFGFMPLFASWTHGDQITVEMMLFLRFGIAGALLALWMLARRTSWPGGQDLITLLVMGGVLYAGMSMCYFYGLQRIPAGLVALLLYLYPVIVTVLARVLLNEQLSSERLLAIATAVAGLGLTIGPVAFDSVPTDATDADHHAHRRDDLIGILLGIGSAVLLSIYIILGRRLTRRVSVSSTSTLVMLSTALVFGLIAIPRGDALPTSVMAWTGAICLAIFSTLVAVTAFLAGLRRIGAVRASTLSTLEALTTVLVSATFLHEKLFMVQLLGGALILIAAIIIARSASVPESG